MRLTEFDQWILWREVMRGDKKDKSTKMPCNKLGKATSITNKQCFKTFDQAYEEWMNDKSNIIDGIGFCLTEEDEFCCIDLDSIDKWYGWREIIKKLDSYTEWSPSGNGLHVWIKGYIPGEENCKKIGNHNDGGIEIYDANHYMTVTFDTLDTSKDICHKQEAIKWLYDGMNDRRLVSKVMTSSAVDKMQLLWDGEWKKAGYESHSEADLAFCRVLNNNHAPIHQIDRIFRKTKLFRPKWTEKRGKETYGQLTLRTATTERN